MTEWKLDGRKRGGGDTQGEQDWWYGKSERFTNGGDQP